MPPFNNAGWPPEIFAIAIAMHADGKDSVQIGDAIGKKRDAVRNYMLRRGYRFEKDAWPAEDIETLRRLAAEGHSATQIGIRMDRPKGAISGKLSRTGIRLAQAAVPCVVWTDEMIAKGRDMATEGQSRRMIGLALGVTHGSVNRYAKMHAWPGREKVVAPAPRGFVLQPISVKPASVRAPRIMVDDVASDDLPTVLTLAPHMCKWPMGSVPRGCGDQQRFCGEFSDIGATYCAGHAQAAHG